MKIIYTKYWYKIFLILFLIGNTLIQVRSILFSHLILKHLNHLRTITHIVSISISLFVWYCIIKESIKIKKAIKIFVYFQLIFIVGIIILKLVTYSIFNERIGKNPLPRFAFGFVPEIFYFALCFIVYVFILMNVKSIRIIEDDLPEVANG